MILPIAALILAQAPTVEVLVQTPTAPKLPETTREEARGLLREAVEKALRERLERLGYQPLILVEERLPDTPKAADAKRLADGGHVNVTVIRIEKWDQKNRSQSEIIDHPNEPKSDTKAQIRVWHLANGAIASSDKREGKAGGPYFGTTDRYEMSGSPAAKSLSIRLVNHKRLESVGAAVWDAVRLDFPDRSKG